MEHDQRYCSSLNKEITIKGNANMVCKGKTKKCADETSKNGAEAVLNSLVSYGGIIYRYHEVMRDLTNKGISQTAQNFFLERGHITDINNLAGYVDSMFKDYPQENKPIQSIDGVNFTNMGLPIKLERDNSGKIVSCEYPGGIPDQYLAVEDWLDLPCENTENLIYFNISNQRLKNSVLLNEIADETLPSIKTQKEAIDIMRKFVFVGKRGDKASVYGLNVLWLRSKKPKETHYVILKNDSPNKAEMLSNGYVDTTSTILSLIN